MQKLSALRCCPSLRQTAFHQKVMDGRADNSIRELHFRGRPGPILWRSGPSGAPCEGEPERPYLSGVASALLPAGSLRPFACSPEIGLSELRWHRISVTLSRRVVPFEAALSLPAPVAPVLVFEPAPHRLIGRARAGALLSLLWLLASFRISLIWPF